MEAFEKGKFNTNAYGSNVSNPEVKPMWAKGVNELSADSQKCPGCGANLTFNPDFQSMVCTSCGGFFKPRSLKRIAESKSYEIGEITKEDEKRHEISCNSCGAHIVADINTSATICPFCGSPALIIGRLTRKFEPDYIIPFKYGKEEAQKMFLEWAKQNKYTPSNFSSKENIEKITGIYVPFWLTDAECIMNIEGTGHMAMQDNEIAQFVISRKCDINFDMIPFDGSSKWDDTYMEAIEPYDYSKMELFAEGQGYISGFMAERYDISHIRMSKRIVGRIKRYIRDEFKAITTEYDKVDIGEDISSVEKLKFYYCLAPIWFINYEYDGEKYRFIMNGQTGKIAGDMPLSKPKTTLFYTKAYSIVAAITVAGFLLTKKIFSLRFLEKEILEARISILFGLIVAFIFIFVICSAIYYIAHYQLQAPMEDKKPKAAQYIKNYSRKDVIKNDNLLSVYHNGDTFREMMWKRDHPHEDEKQTGEALKFGRSVVKNLAGLVSSISSSRRRFF